MAKITLKTAKNRFSKSEYNVLDLYRENEEEVCLIFINYLQNYSKGIGLRTTLIECNIIKNDLESIAFTSFFYK